MAGTYDPINLIKTGIAELDCSGAVFLAIAGTSSPARLSQALNGIKALDGPEAVALMTTLGEMKALAAEVHPIPIAWKPQIIRGILADRRKHRGGGAPVEAFFGVSTCDGVYFINNIRGEIKTVPRSQIMATGMSLAVANRVVAELKALRFDDAKVFRHPNCGSNVAATDFSDVWHQ